MKKKFNKSEGGFTIIEVVLVLAIAGLIFMVVFLALPGLQANQRDTQRRQVLGSAVSAVVTYQSNNKGSLPSNTPLAGGTGDFKAWVSSPASFAEPRTGTEYKVKEETVTMSTTDGLLDSVIYFARAKTGSGAQYPKCGANGLIEFVAAATATEKNSFVMTLLLDSGNQLYCQAS